MGYKPWALRSRGHTVELKIPLLKPIDHFIPHTQHFSHLWTDGLYYEYVETHLWLDLSQNIPHRGYFGGQKIGPLMQWRYASLNTSEGHIGYLDFELTCITVYILHTTQHNQSVLRVSYLCQDISVFVDLIHKALIFEVTYILCL